VGGSLLGDPDYIVSGVASLENAAVDKLSFLVSARQLTGPLAARPGVLLVSAEEADRFDGNRILVSNPYLAYARASALFVQDGAEPDAQPVHPSAVIAADAEIGERVRIGPGCIVGSGCRLGDGVTLGARVVLEMDCTVGEGSRLESSVTICRNTRIGRFCVISPGVVIGASGFGYAPEDTRWCRIHQLGGVVIGDEVDIGANTTIDRGAIDDTVIGDRVKLDNLIQIAHNVRIGDDTIMAACTGVAGSAVIGRRCRIGGRVSINGHITIADDSVMNACSFIARSIDEAGTWSSAVPAQPVTRWRRIVASLNRLPDRRKKASGRG
jgi:UDP-3-O-[3-hydroxymyristoyl] glucosamine N-acyltransferase